LLPFVVFNTSDYAWDLSHIYFISISSVFKILAFLQRTLVHNKVFDVKPIRGYRGRASAYTESARIIPLLGGKNA
jgi:hypothetical protein